MKARDIAASIEWRKFAPIIIVACGVLAYANSFSRPFIFDDSLVILNIQGQPVLAALENVMQPAGWSLT